MSKLSIPKVVLSAYFDGEVSADERAAVGRAAEKSPAVQQTLDDYTQLSEDLRALKQRVPASQLRDAVLAEIQSSPRPQVVPASMLLKRRWVKIAGGVLAATAAGLLLTIWPQGDPQDNRAEFALREVDHHDSDHAEAAPGIAVAAGDPAGSLEADGIGGGSRREAGAIESLLADSSPAPANEPFTGSSAEAQPFRTVSIPEWWLTQQAAKDHRLPQPGDMIKYLVQVADETVRIPMTVVDVQMTAGQVRFLLARHGIQSPGNGVPASVGETDDGSVAILVEAPWESVCAVLDDLDAEFELSRFVASSPETQQAMMAQNSLIAEENADVPAARSQLTENPASFAQNPLAAGSPADEKQETHLAESERDSETAGGLFLEALVSDEVNKMLEQLGLSEPSGKIGTGVTESPAREQPPAPADPAVVEVDDDNTNNTKRKPWQHYATEGPARILFVIQKSGGNR